MTRLATIARRTLCRLGWHDLHEWTAVSWGCGCTYHQARCQRLGCAYVDVVEDGAR